MTRMTPGRFYLLLAMAALATTFFVIGLPDALEASRHSRATGQPAPGNSWMNIAVLFGFPAWLWVAVLTVRAREWGWLLIASVGSYLGIFAYAVRGLRAIRSGDSVSAPA